MQLSQEQKGFYRRAMTIAIPIMVQNGITNFVSMLDNIMVGRVGTDAMSAVSIVNQLLFVWILCLFGGTSGIGIFTAQFYGKGDHEGIRYTFRLEMMLGAILVAVGFLIFKTSDAPLISLYLKGDEGSGDPQATLALGIAYLAVMCWEFLPVAVTQVYASTLRSTGETVVPMRASLIAVAVNLVGNYILIYGKFGAPALGVVGAAIATVISRFVETAYVVFWTHAHKERNAFIVGAYRSLYVPASLTKNCILKGLPLMINETMWSAGMAVMSRNYSLRGLDVVAASNISSTISNVFNVSFIAMGSAIAIIIGQELGAGHLDTVKRDARRLSIFSVLICVIFGAGLCAVSGVYPLIYNTTDEVRRLATGFIIIGGICMPLYAYENAAYFIIRSGGKTLITFFFDSCFVWIASIPLSFILACYTELSILPIFAIIQSLSIIKCTIGAILVRKGIWINDLTNYA